MVMLVVSHTFKACFTGLLHLQIHSRTGAECYCAETNCMKDP